MTPPPNAPRAALVWAQFAPYHVDRLEALARRVAPDWQVEGIEIAAESRTYAWPPTSPGTGYRHTTLRHDVPAEAVRGWRRLRLLWRACRGSRVVFLCNYERPETWVLATALRLTGRLSRRGTGRLTRRRVVLMFDSTAADKPRRRWREAVKRAALAPYDAALVSGPTSRAYLDSLGFKGRPVALGYDTLGTARLRAEAGGAPAPRGHAEADRVFLIVARCVPEKNIAGALDAYAHYAARARGEGRTPRPLWICGDGPLRGALEARAAALQLRGCRFLGFRAPAEVAGLLGRALALLLPSHSEPWGLVVNEALALGVPVVASTRAGAARDLLRHDLAGWALAPDDTAAWAEAMRRLDGDPALWRRLATGARDNAAAGDVARFAEGAAALLEHRT